jgi:hypothetical protein
MRREQSHPVLAGCTVCNYTAVRNWRMRTMTSDALDQFIEAGPDDQNGKQ